MGVTTRTPLDSLVLKRLLLAALAGLALLWWLRPGQMPMQSLPLYADGAQTRQQLVGGPCTRARCLIVYVAPWCPYCRAAQPMLRQLREALEKDGIPMQVVVGMDKPPALEAYARALELPALLDIGGVLKQHVKIKGVPYFIVTDERGRIRQTASGAYPDAVLMRGQLGL